MSRGCYSQVGGARRRRARRGLLVLATAAALGVKVPAASPPSPQSEPVPPALNHDAVFTRITIEEGLSDQRVQAVLQDRAGFMWFGTNNGLNRYDGHTIVEYRNDPAIPHSLSGNLIEAIYEDRSGTLWVGTRSGLNAFDRGTERFTRYRHDPASPRSLSDNTVSAIHEDRSRALWLGTSSGLNRFDRATGEFTVYRHDPANPKSLPHNNVRVIIEDRGGTLWVGTFGGLGRFDRTTGTFTTYRHDPANPRSLSHDVVWDLIEDRAGTIWVGTDGGGLSRFDPATNEFTHFRHDPGDPRSLGGDRIAHMWEDASGALWVTTFGSGLSVLDPARQTFRRYRHDSTDSASVSSDYLDEIVSDRTGLIWFGTHGSGVNVHDPRRSPFTIYRHDPEAAAGLASNHVWAVSEDTSGNLWLGTQDSGLERLDRRSGRVVHYPPDPKNPQGLGYAWVAALEPDPKGWLWVGTYGGGLYRFDPGRERFAAYRHDPANPRSLSHDAITDLHRDRAGSLWVGTRGGGLNRFDPATGAFTVYRYDPSNPAGLSSDWVWAIAEDAGGSLWIGTLGGGLNRLDPATGRVTRYRHAPGDMTSLSDDSIWTLHVDRSDVLWVGTFGGGLDRFDRARGAFTHYRERDGLSSDRVVAILEDGRVGDPAGNLWVATGRGLSKLDRDRRTFHNYGTTHGLPLTEYNRGVQVARDGTLLISSAHGLIAFDSDAVHAQTEIAPVVFTNFLLANKPVRIGEGSPLRQAVNQTSSITLNHADRVISFEFAALDYRAPRQARYRYRLDGFDDDWIEVGSAQRLVTYTNLAPRKYVFRVTAANADGVWSKAERAIALVMTPPWWATWWFRGVALVLIAGCVTGLFAWRLNGLERRRRALEAEIGERKQIEAALRASNQQIQDLAGRLITAQEGERARLARELHDDVNQQLAALSISLGGLKRRLPSHLVEGHLEIAGLQQQATGVSEAIRSLSHELHPSVLQHFGLVAALKGGCGEVASVKNLDVVFHADDRLGDIPADVGLCLYRVAQEALHNAARHAQARRVEVSLTAIDAESVELRVVDDGRGFDLEEARLRGGLGLISIDERVRLVAGQVHIRSERGRGTDLRARVPLRVGEDMPVREEHEPSESAAR
jgi:ligand-binding sensor domain-containing protein/signal transduction histidine kinase